MTDHSGEPPSDLQAVLDHFERRGLLADEQHCFPVRKSISNHVGDRLALAGTRRFVELVLRYGFK